jgi:hypothetical protein
VPENKTRVPAPRVPFLDTRTGAVSREWYRFLLSLNGEVDNLVDVEVDDFSLEPDASVATADLAALQVQISAQDIRPPVEPRPPRYYGEFYDESLQTAAAINTAYPVEFDTPTTSFGVRVVSASRVTFDNAGRYLLSFTLNAALNAAPAGTLYTWLRRGGVTDLTNSANLAQIAAATVVTRSFLLTVAAGQFVEVMWAVSDTDVRLQAAAAAAPVPSAPSASLIVTGVQ